jgi:hypothetical protein
LQTSSSSTLFAECTRADRFEHPAVMTRFA